MGIVLDGEVKERTMGVKGREDRYKKRSKI
jgi:hypothetical protein